MKTIRAFAKSLPLLLLAFVVSSPAHAADQTAQVVGGILNGVAGIVGAATGYGAPAGCQTGYYGGNQVGSPSGYQGGFQGGYQGVYSGAYQGGYPSSYQGGSQGGYQGSYAGAYQGGNQAVYPSGYQGDSISPTQFQINGTNGSQLKFNRYPGGGGYFDVRTPNGDRMYYQQDRFGRGHGTVKENGQTYTIRKGW